MRFTCVFTGEAISEERRGWRRGLEPLRDCGGDERKVRETEWAHADSGLAAAISQLLEIYIFDVLTKGGHRNALNLHTYGMNFAAIEGKFKNSLEVVFGSPQRKEWEFCDGRGP